MLNHEKLKKTLAELQELAKDATLLVEGKKDKAALQSLGVDGDFFLLGSQKQSLQESAEKLAKKQKIVVLLLDADKKGKELTKEMITYLQTCGAKVNRKIGSTLLKIANSRTVEGLKNK